MEPLNCGHVQLGLFAFPSCVVLEWLSSLVPLAVDRAITAMALQIVPQLPGAVGAALTQAADPGPEVMAVLEQDAEAELQALFEALEPALLNAPEN